MARWTGEWLPGSGDGIGTDPEREQRWRGQSFGLPEKGVGSVGSGGARLVGFLIDLVIAGLVTSLFMPIELQNPAAMQSYNLWAGVVWAVLSAVPVSFFGFTPGMAVLGIRVARLDGASMVGVWRAVVRAVLSFLILPAAIRNIDGRSWADRVTGTVVVRMR
ncbi:RDD family protein [Amycolatopsis sp. cg5]|uniref:RDD family protein n=1 Tax=Amycolatopsis sp. cg5 TaxID=3238802 RepID=UPI00352317A4